MFISDFAIKRPVVTVVSMLALVLFGLVALVRLQTDEFPAGRRTGLLEGVRVLDLTRFLAGPFAGMVLGDLGAEVIKVEQMSGDSTRYNPPYYFEGDSAYFLSINRNKKSIAIDLKSAAGRKILHELVGTADIIIDNLRATQREALGLSYETLKEINPGIVSTSVTS